jgi:N,N'-diacetyl-8-epilegionaminate cytidylyltransferase
MNWRQDKRYVGDCRHSVVGEMYPICVDGVYVPGGGLLKSQVVGFVFARGGSKGVLRKNLRHIADKPLIAHAIETAQSSGLIDRVVVSTDDEEIAEVARRYGAEVPFMRPQELAQDNSPERLAWQHALRTVNEDPNAAPVDVFVCIPTTSPLRKVEDIDACIRLLLKGDSDIVITVKSAARSPYYNMVVIDDDGYAQLVIPPSKSIHQRHHVPAVYDMTTVAYAAKPSYVLETDYIFDGRVKAVVVESETGMDIDSEMDLAIAEFLSDMTSRRESSSL